MNRPAIRSICVVGDGIVGLSAALAFSRALPGVRVSVLRQPGEAASFADRVPIALPTIGRFHAAIGLDELDLVRRRIAVHHLGCSVKERDGRGWLHTFGEVGRSEGQVSFHQLWLQASQAGEALPFDRYSTASVIGAAGKFVHPSGDPNSPLATYLYGLRLDPSAYRARLKAATAHLAHVEGTIIGIDRREDGKVAALHLDNGTVVEADLYVDCGPSDSGLSADETYIDWQDDLPAVHIAIRSTTGSTAEPLSSIQVIDGGWDLTLTLPDTMLHVHVTAEPTEESIEFRPGRRTDAFVGNVLAIGESAVALDPLHGTNLSLAHSAILRAIDLLPGRDCHPLELAEYNRLTTLAADRARDFHALFQSRLAPGVSPPQSLARTLSQWRSRGRLPFFEEETFTPSSWMQLLFGLGIVPDNVAPTARAIDDRAAAPAMRALAKDLTDLAARLPSYSDYLARISAGAG